MERMMNDLKAESTEYWEFRSTDENTMTVGKGNRTAVTLSAKPDSVSIRVPPYLLGRSAVSAGLAASHGAGLSGQAPRAGLL